MRAQTQDKFEIGDGVQTHATGRLYFVIGKEVSDLGIRLYRVSECRANTSDEFLFTEWQIQYAGSRIHDGRAD